MAANPGKPMAEAPADKDELRAQLDTIRKDISDLTAIVADIGTRRKDAATRQIHDKVTDLRGRAEAAGADVAEQLDALASRAQAHVREQPGSALLMAGGVGFLVGLLLARR